MRTFDRIFVSIRHIRGRLVESILVMLAVAVGVALVAAMAAFIRSYNQQTILLLDHPAYREVLVEAVGNESELESAAVPYDPQVTSEASLDNEDLAAAMENSSVVAYGYLGDQEQLSTQVGAGRAGGIRGLGRAAFQGQTPPEGAEPGQLADPRGFDLEEFLQVDDDVLTELPLESFPGWRVTPDFFEAYDLSVVNGSSMTAMDIEAGNQVMIVGHELAQALFPDGDAVGSRVRLNLQTFTVIGVLGSSDLTNTETGMSFDDVAFVPHGDAQISFGGNAVRLRRPNQTLRFAVEDSADLETAMNELQAHFDSEFGTGAVRIVAPLEDLQNERNKLSRVLTVVLFLAAAGLFIASINLFNLMLMRVIRRTKSVGIMRALGATRTQVTMQFMTESGLMSVIGAAAGLGASPFVFRMLQSALISDAAAQASASGLFLVAGAVGALVFSLVFGVLPAQQAGRIDAALAIRSE